MLVYLHMPLDGLFVSEMDLLTPKKNSWRRKILCVALVEAVWLSFCWFALSHPTPTQLQIDLACGLMLAGAFFSIWFAMWWNDIDIPMKEIKK